MKVKKAPPKRLSTTTSASRRGALAVARSDAWAELLELKVDGKQFSTKGREYIIQVMRDQSPEIVIKKAAQLGFTVAMIIRSLHNVTERRWHGLYLMPYKNGAITFVQGRIDTIIDSSPALSGQFKRVENRTHKQTGEAVNLYIRGTNVVTELREIPVDFEIWDERDKFVENNLSEALARMDGSTVRQLIQLSTPTAPGQGVSSDENWESSDQSLWEIPCPYCGKFQFLSFSENVRLGDTAEESVVECSFCKKELSDSNRWNANTNGRWVPQYLDGRKRGYHLTQLNSPTKPFLTFIQAWFDGQSSSAKLRGFYNNGLGEPYAGSDDCFTEQLLDDCKLNGFKLRTIPQGPIFVGIDVGAGLHVKASYWGRVNGQDKRMAYEVKVFTGERKWHELDQYLAGLHNFSGVIDAQPEKTKSKELAMKYRGKLWIGFERDRPNQAEVAVFNEPKKRDDVGTVTIDRTMAFDQYIRDHQKGLYIYPANARELGEELPRRNYNGFYAHHFEMVRVEEENVKGVIVARWKKTRNPDHFHHAGMFESIAFEKRPKLSVPLGIRESFNRAGSLVGG